MTTNRRLSTFLSVVCVGAAFSLSVTACRETSDEHYRDAKEARQARAIERGLIPAVLPPSALDIFVRVNFDTNETWGTFTFDPQDISLLRDRLQAGATAAPSARPRSNPRTAWWPRELERGTAMGADATRLNIYKRDGPGRGATRAFVIAADWDRRTCYFWAEGS